eukprot:70490_1
MQIQYTQFDVNEKQKHNADSEYYKQLESQYEADRSMRQTRSRDIKLCHLINCEFENEDTIPSQQLDIGVFSEAEIQHVWQCHPDFYLRLTIWTKTTENDMNQNVQWDEPPSYFMQMTYMDPDLTDFHLYITSNETSKKRKKIFIKDMEEKTVNENKIEHVITINKGKCSAEVDIEIYEKHRGLHLLGLFENKRTTKAIPNSNTIPVMVETDINVIPPEDDTYHPKCINLETVRLVKDQKNKRVNVYWNTPLETYGEISYN